MKALQRLFPTINILTSTWVFKVKRNQNNEITEFRARLCARGDRQKYGIDYKQTFSPVARLESFRILLSLCASYKLIMHSVDTRSAQGNGVHAHTERNYRNTERKMYEIT